MVIAAVLQPGMESMPNYQGGVSAPKKSVAPVDDAYANALLRKRDLLTQMLDMQTASMNSQESAGYGEIAAKHAENLPDVAKSTGGSVLQYLGEMGKYSPQLSLGSAVANLYFADKGGAGNVGADIRQQAQQDIAQNQPYIRPQDKGKQYVSDVARGVEEMTPGLAASLATRSPFPMLAQAGTRGVAESYGEQREAGRTPLQSAGAALPSGVAEVAFEYPVAKVLTMGGSSFLKKVIGGIVGEGVSEGATSLVQQGIEKGTIDPNKTIDEILKQAGYESLVGMGAGGVVSIPAHIADVATRGEKTAPEGEFYTPTQDVVDMFAGQQLALPAPEKQLGLPAPDYSQTPMVGGKEGVRYQTQDETNQINEKRQRDYELGLNEINLTTEAERNAKIPKAAKPLSLPSPDYSKAPFEGAPLVGDKGNLRYQTLPEKQQIQQNQQRQIDMGYKDTPRLSEATIQKLRTARQEREAKDAKATFTKQAREEKATQQAEQKAQSEVKRDTLFNFIANTGGIKKDAQGELKQALGDINPLIPGRGRLIREKGKSLDYVREAAVEAGYLPEDATIDDLLQAVESEARGAPVRKPEAIIEPTQQDYVNDLQLEAYKAGVSIEGKNPEQIAAELEAKRPVEEDAETEDPMLELERMEAPIEDDEDFDIPFDSPVTKAKDVIAEEKSPMVNIQDFGEKLSGAKKELWARYNTQLSSELPDSPFNITLSKHFPEPNYEKALEDGMDIRILAAVRAIRDEMPSKPKQPMALIRWAQTLRTLREMAQKLMSGDTGYEDFKRVAEQNDRLAGVIRKIELAQDVGYPAFKKLTNDTRIAQLGKNKWMATTGVKTWSGFQGQAFDTREEAVQYLRDAFAEKPKEEKKVKLDLYRMKSSGDIVIGKKIGTRNFIDLKAGFKTAAEARNYLADNYEALVKSLGEKRTIPQTRRSINTERVGEDYRKGDDALPDMFAKEFGFRGVQFGNYVEQKRRMQDLNNAYDAFIDMADLLGIPHDTVSLDGKLGLAFGARGVGGKDPASAHFERAGNIINLTKNSGAGSLGHEWFHAMDAYFGEQGGVEFMTETPRARVKEKDGIVSESVRPELVGKFKELMQAINKTQMYERSKKLDNRKTKPYFSTKIEMAARAFESYLIHKAAQKNESNDYLANIVDQKAWDIADEGTYPYLTPKEMVEVAPAFDDLFSSMKVKTGTSGRGTLYSGLDPALISELFGNKEERAEFYAGLKKVPKGLKHLTRVTGGGLGTLFLSIDDALRARAKIHKMPTITKIADMLYDGTQNTYGEAVRTRQTVNHNKVERILTPIRKSKKMLNRTIELIQNPKEIKINRSHEDNAAAGIAKLLADERQYMIDAGVEVGEIEGYFPRVYDLVKILRNEQAFLNAAKKAYKATYPELPQDEIAAKADAWLANVKLNNAGVSTDVGDLSRRSGVPKPNSLKERALSKDSDSILKEFLVQDPQEVLTQHFISTAKKAEFERRFNTESWRALKDAMIAEANARPLEQQQQAYDAIRKTSSDILSATGNSAGNLPQGASDILSWLKMFGAMGMLPHAVLTSLPEVVMPALRAGDVRESFAAFTTAWRALTKDKSYAEQKEMAEEVIGVAAKAVSDMAAEQRMGGELGTATTRKLMAKYFTATGLHGFTEGMRVASTGVGMRYLARLSKEMTKSPIKTKLYMRDLGIDPKAAEGFSKWVLENNEGKLKPSQLQSDNKYVDMYKRALTRFVDQSVMKPEAVEKPRYASHKIGSLFYYLQSFIYGYQKNVLLRQARNVKRAATESGLTPANRAALAAPLILTPIILGALQYGLGDLRDEILDSETKKKMSDERKVARALSRTGYYGQLDPWVNLFAGLKYQREPATTLAGPVFGGVLDTFAAMANLAIGNSEKTNTQERKAAQQFWRTAAKPMMVATFTAMPGMMKVPLIQMISHPQIEEEFIQSVAGRKKK